MRQRALQIPPAIAGFRSGVVAILIVHAALSGCAARGALQHKDAATIAWSIFIDDLHIDFRNTGRVRDGLRAMAAALIREGDTFALSCSGPSQIDFPLTTYRSFLAPALWKVTGNGLRVSDIPPSPDQASLREVRYRTTTALRAARAALERLIQHRRLSRSPQAFVYMTNGYYAAGPEIRDAVSSLAMRARRARIKVFVIDARAVGAVPSDLDTVSEGWASYLTITQSSLAPLVAQTGGLALLTRQELTDGYRRINTAMGR